MSTPSQLGEKRPPFPVSLHAVETRARRDDARVPLLLIDARPLTREWLAKWLEEILGGFHVTAVAGPDEVGDQHSGDAELAILNVGPAPADDPEIGDEIGRLRRRFPDIPIILFAECEEIGQVAAAIRQGVRGYITSKLSPEVVIAVLQLVRSGGTFVPASVVLQAARRMPRPEQELAPRPRS